VKVAPALQPVLAAFSFLTRLPVPSVPTRDEDLGRSVAFYPLVGLALGLGAGGVAAILAGPTSPLLAATLGAGFLAALTGGLHLDGLADLFDGLGGGRGDRARILEIMRDGRIGAHGATALVLVLVAKVAAIAELATRGNLFALVLFPCLARWAVTPLVAFLPYARPEGTGRAFVGNTGAREVAIATGTAALVVGLSGGGLVVPALAAAAVEGAFGLAIARKLGGLTGDVYGAAIELGEVTVLTVAAMIR
jgi:adenosylcobinamide-GDP ribazoletransferase